MKNFLNSLFDAFKKGKPGADINREIGRIGLEQKNLVAGDNCMAVNVLLV